MAQIRESGSTGPRGREYLLTAGMPALTAIAAIAVMLWHFAGPGQLDPAGLFDAPAVEVVQGEDIWLPPPRYEYAGGERDEDPSIRLVSATVHRERVPSKDLHVTYPPDGAVFPANLCAPGIEWHDERNAVWRVTVRPAGGEAGAQSRGFILRERRLRVPAGLWRTVKETGGAQITVEGASRSRGSVHRASIAIEVSEDPCDDFVVYRLVTPPFDPKTTPDTFIRDVRERKPEPFLLAHRKYCFNCHTFSSKTPENSLVSFQARFMGREKKEVPTYFAVYDLAARGGWRVKLPFEIQMTTFMRWSPDRKKLALSANQKLVTYAPVVHETQYTGQPTSDIGIYDAERGDAFLLPGASDPWVLELLPEWTPDGESVVFCVTDPGIHPADSIFDMKVVPYNGGRGGKARFIPGASHNGMSSHYARFSPDRRWMAFCQSVREYNIQPSSDLCLMRGDLTGGARRLECNALYAADSWHSWSSNSKWLLFASKRDDGVYARVYFTHIDGEGRASPAVRLPLSDEPMASFNIPEFVARRPDVTEAALFDAIQVDRPYREVKLRETVK